jgi:membrane protein
MQAPDVTTHAKDTAKLLIYAGQRFLADGGLRTAAALSYSSLLAMVPLFAISLAILSAFDAFEQVRVDLQLMLFESMMPDASLAVSDHFATFLNNANRMTGVGIVGLGVVAVLLLNTITGGLNAIWRVSEPRSLVLRMLVYWALLTLGPLLLGASLSLSSYAFAAVQWSGVEDYTPPFLSARILPVLLSTLGFTLMYMVVPNRSVRLKHAFLGALASALLLETLKASFGLYLRNFPTYQVIYGALAALPIFLLWMYLSWAVVLLGAEFAASLPEWRTARQRSRKSGDPGAELALALALLGRLQDAARDGRLLRESRLARGLPATLQEFDHVLRSLRRRRFVARSGTRWLLARDLTATSLEDLVRALGLSFEPGEGWPAPVPEILGELSATGAEMRGRSLSQLLQVQAEAPAAS